MSDPSPRPTRRAYKFLLRPTASQVSALNATLAIHCEIYNAALEHRREAWNRARVSVSWVDQCRELTEIRKIRPDVAAVNAKSAQQTLRRLDRSFSAYYRRCRSGEKPGYPRFRSIRRFDSITFSQPPADGGLRAGYVHVPCIGSVRAHQHRALANGARVKQVMVKREGSRWYVIFSCDDIPVEPLPTTGAVVGIDLGIESFLTTSNGAHVPNPRHFAVTAGRLAAAQRELARKKRGSKRRRKAVAKVVSLHGKVRRSRHDHAHKTALALIRDQDLIVHEDLQIANMGRRPKPKLADDGSYEPNGAAAKAGLNRSIQDAGWGIFLRVLADKAESAGRLVIAVNPRHTSQKCAECGQVAAGNRASQAVFRCLACGHEAHADVNAAINILRSGLDLREAA